LALKEEKKKEEEEKKRDWNRLSSIF